MIDPNHYLEEAKQNLEKWKDRYSESEYPEKVLLNLFYKKYATLEMWSTFKSFFKKPFLGSRKVFWTQFNDGYNQLRELHRNTARIKVNPVLESNLQSEKSRVIGSISYADFIPLLTRAKQGNSKSLKEIEIAYLTHYLADECILLWSVLGGKGLSEMDAFNKLCSTSLKSIKLNTYAEAEREFIKFWVPATSNKSSINVKINHNSVQPLVEKLAEVYENSYAKATSNARNKAYFDISLGLMTQINGVLQANLNQWNIEKTGLYGQRMIYCNNIHMAIESYIDNSLALEDLKLAINSITILYTSTVEEQAPNLDPSNEVMFMRVVQGMLLPQFLLLKFLNNIYNGLQE